eukprot:Clim_evm16s146 gene=Clim_evmTU16s146
MSEAGKPIPTDSPLAQIVRGEYPIVDPDPSLGRILSNFNGSDYMESVGIMGLCYGYCLYALPRKDPVFMGTGLLIGGSAVFWKMFQKSSMRLRGLRENSAEVAKYGIHPIDSKVPHLD